MLQHLVIALAAAAAAQSVEPAEQETVRKQEAATAVQSAQSAAQPAQRQIQRQITRQPAPTRQVVRRITQTDSFHDPKSVSWYFRYGLSSNAYKNAWDTYKGRGQVPIDIETDRIGSNTRYSGVWQKNEDNRGWVSYRNLTSDGFHEKWAEYRDKGYRPIDQDTAMVNGAVRYSLIMVQNKEGLKWISNRNLTSAQFSEKFNQYKGEYMPIDVDAVNVNGSMRYSIIWVENKSNTGWVELRDMTPNTYGEKFKQYSDQGYRVADLDCYANTSGQLRYAAIWEKNKPGRGWAARREMSATGLRNWWKKYADQGMRVIDIEICPRKSGSGVRYAAVWRENDKRFDWSGRAAAEQALSDYVTNASAPGVAAAIIRNGEVLFRGGAGDADSEKSIRAHAGTIYRLASVSKAVAGTLAYDMEEAGIIDLDDRTDTLISGLGTQHVHTVRQLLRNESCVEHYTSDGNNDNGTQVTYQTAQNALDNHMGGAMKANSWIISGCSTGQWNYSTHGYTLAGAALEAEGGASFANLLRTRISDPFNLDTLRVEFRTSPDSSGERAKIYTNSGPVSDSGFQNTSWKAGGGGMEASALDLARFGDAVLRNRYFPQGTRDTMWTGSQNGRANGWSFSGGQATKGGDQQGSDSHIRIDTNTGVTVVVLTNVNPPGVETSTLSNQLRGIANAN